MRMDTPLIDVARLDDPRTKIHELPFPFLIAEGQLPPEAAAELDRDFPHYDSAGFFPYAPEDCGPSINAVVEAMSLSFKLTAREAEVLYWVVKGKINRDIGDILGASPATVKKHLERVYAKLGVETRTAAAGMAMNRIRQLHPQFEG